MDGICTSGLEELRGLGATLHEIPMRREVGPWDALDALRMRRLIRSRGPFDVVHGHSSKAGALVRIARTPAAGRVVYTPHAPITMATNIGARKRWLFATVERRLAGRCDAVIAVSNYERRHMVELGVPERIVHVVPNGVWLAEPIEAIPRESFGVPDDAIVFGFVGRFSPQKDVANLVRAFAGPHAAEPHAWLLLVGGGPLEAEARTLAAEIGVADRIAWAGERDGPACMPAMDVFTLPSIYEGFPYVFPEALRAGLPIVTTLVGGAEDVVEEGVSGRIVPVRDPDALGEAMTALALDAELRARMATAAREIASRFDVEAMVESTLAVYGG